MGTAVVFEPEPLLDTDTETDPRTLTLSRLETATDVDTVQGTPQLLTPRTATKLKERPDLGFHIPIEIPPPRKPEMLEIEIETETETGGKADVQSSGVTKRDLELRAALGQYPDTVHYTAEARHEIDLHTGETTSHLEELGPVNLDFSDLPLEGDRLLAGRNLDIEIDRAGVPKFSPQWRREHIVHERGSTHSPRNPGSKPRGGQELRASRRRRR